MKYKGVIFDMDGLIFDTEKLYFEANKKVAPKYGIRYNEEYYEQFIGISDEETHATYRKDNPHLSDEKINAFIEEGYDEIEKMFLAGEAELKPGVLELLDFLEKEDVPRVVASSNLRRFIDILLEKAGIRHYFSEIISCEDVKKAKPDPEIIEKALVALNTQPHETVMLEDSKNGILASHQANVPVIMVPDLIPATPELEEKVLGIFDSLHDVREYFKK